MRIKQIICVVMSVVLLSGCEAEQEIPDLIEPVVNNESFRPVEYGSVGKTEIQIADVAPEEYCHFITKASVIDEICVDLGQYVEEGDILAAVDVSDFQLELDAKQKELNLRKNNYSYQEQIYKEEIQIQKYQREDFKKQKDKEAVKVCNTAIDVLEENRRYDRLLYEHQVIMLEEEIAELRKDTKEGTIRATHSGYVTYVKNLETSNLISAYENVVIVSDYNQLHLELDQDLSSRLYTHYIGDVYNRIYTIMNGTKCDVEVYKYSNAELIAMQSADQFPRIRLEVEGLESSISAGDKLVVYFANSTKGHVLRIGTDSLYNENEKYFVYVKNGAGKEKREIQIGYQGESYVEVTDGLEEGEWVYYSSGSIMPDKYEKHKVVKSDYTPTNSDIGLKGSLIYTKTYPYILEKDAVVEAVYFANGDTVKKGDLICVLNMGTGGAQMTEIKQNMSNLTQDYETNIESLDKQIKKLNKEIKKEKVETKKKDANEEVDTTTIVEQLQCQKTILQYEKKKMKAQYEYDHQMLQQTYDWMLKINNGQGKLEIYAKQDGILGSVNVYEDKNMKVEEEPVLFQIYDASSRKLLINTKEDYIGAGNQVEVKNGTDENAFITGIVVGNSAAGKAYVASKDEKIYITHSNVSSGENKAYLSVKDSDWSEEVIGAQVKYSLANVRDVVVIPDTMLYEEVNQWNPEIKNYYVWKVIDNILVKQYVQIEEAFRTTNQVCILDGLETGDVLAIQTMDEE